MADSQTEAGRKERIIHGYIVIVLASVLIVWSFFWKWQWQNVAIWAMMVAFIVSAIRNIVRLSKEVVNSG